MGPDPGRLARQLTFALMAVAYANCEVASYLDGQPRAFGVGFGLGLFALAVLASYFVPGPAAGQTRPPAKLTAVLAVVLVLPVFVEPLLREWTGNGFPLEMQLVNGLRNLGVALAAASAWPGLRKLAGVVALFLALFSAAMGDQPAMPYLLTLFALVGGVWLVVNHRADLSGAAVAGVAHGAEVRRVRLRLPARELVVFGLLAAAAGVVAFAGPKKVTVTLGEWLPTSGGTGDTDPFARYGVGDGPEETSGDNARAAGMVETDTVIEDNKDALIDAVTETFGPPHKPRGEQERMVAAGQLKVIEHHGKLPDNRRPSRDFDTARKGPRDPGKPPSRAARAVFEVEGRTPLHVRVVAYDRYDPAANRWAQAPKPGSRVFDVEDGDWMRVADKREADWYAADDRHRLKVADLKQNLVPTPALMTGVRIQRVNRPDYYEWDYDGVLALAGRKRTPPGVVVTTDCRTLDPAGLPGSAFAEACNPAYLDVPAPLRPEIDRLAREWAADRPRGWPQVDAVLRCLREHYSLDRDATAPADHPAPALWFLNDSRRGPDYLFATAACLLLRSLGYPARVCLGYYAGPDAFDPESGHTPVKSTDLHVWPEVLLRDGHWLVVEPTPGYDVLPPLRTWSDRLLDAAAGALAWAGRNAVGLSAALVLLGLLAWRRKAVWDRVFTLAWRLAPGRTWREVVLRAVRVLERRARLAGRPRAPAQTLAGWSAELRAGEIGELVRLGEWAAYGPDTPPVPEADVTAVCRRALDRWPMWRLRDRIPVAGEGGAA